MEIEYTNFEIDSKIYGKNSLSGVYEIDSNYVYNSFYDVKKLDYNDNMKVGLFLTVGALKYVKLVNTLMEEFGLSESIKKLKIRELSNQEKIKVLVIKLLISSCKTVILENIDIYMSQRELKTLLKGIKNHLKEVDKNVILSVSKIENLLNYTDRYIIVKNDNIIYNGKDLDLMPIKTDIMSFVDLANQKNANINYYRDVNDLLKAIYRSVKK